MAQVQNVALLDVRQGDWVVRACETCASRVQLRVTHDPIAGPTGEPVTLVTLYWAHDDPPLTAEAHMLVEVIR